ncbi:MAG: malic enzyme-like NAD(P)-binding protein [Campylobacterota bacterium]|nr:malic enzyme-like NAD(P)-binding protein [Campylobacterota bacterium]
MNEKKALDYHEFPQPGKVATKITKSFSTQEDLALAYTPGVAVPCLEIQDNPLNAYKYTSKGNLVAVISNGSAVLGLGDIGALASKPVMEGKAILFKSFGKLDSYDIEVDAKDIDKFCEAVEAIAPTFGGINLEDIKAPECFAIEERLVKELDIPVMHDDQHGTAVISSAAMINAAYLCERELSDLKVVIVGAGAAAISCAKMYRHLGVQQIIMIDSKGVIHSKRDDLNSYKKEFAKTNITTQHEAFHGADMVIGLSRPGTFSVADIKLMSASPIIFTLANPTPEIMPDEVREVRPHAIVATGRSDFENQVNNVLGFPFIFRGAMDVKARKINMQMKIAAARALAELARKDVPQYVCDIYNKELKFSPQYIIPKPFDKRLLSTVSVAVAKAAIESGVAPIMDIEEYKNELEKVSI